MTKNISLEEKKQRAFESNIKANYGLSPGKWQKMFEDQCGRCAICCRPQTDFKRKFNVDHDHKTGEIRALLCGNCNMLLGMAKDDPEILQEAIKYLNKYKDLPEEQTFSKPTW